MYEQENVKCFFEGNPLVDNVSSYILKNKEKNKAIVVGLFAGSRKSTIKKHLPVILDTVKILKERKDNMEFILFTLDKSEQKIPNYIQIKNGNDFKERNKIDIALCPSGTVSLENALLGIPMVVMYKLSWINYFIARLIIKVKYITLVNILLNKELVPECIQYKATGTILSQQIISMLEEKKYNSVRNELLKFQEQLGPLGVYERVAKRILEDK